MFYAIYMKDGIYRENASYEVHGFVTSKERDKWIYNNRWDNSILVARSALGTSPEITKTRDSVKKQNILGINFVKPGEQVGNYVQH